MYRYIHIYLVTYIRCGAPVYPPAERRVYGGAARSARGQLTGISHAPRSVPFGSLPLVLPLRSLSASPFM